MIFYEAPHKLPATLKDMAEYFGDRKIALVKELTKIHENVEHTTLFSARDKYNELAPKGEFVVIVEGKPEEEKTEITLEDATYMAKELIKDGISINEASKEIAKKTGLKKSDIYKSLQNT
jgi:16S rRNA (cytidine1402-2'-O)-methyltransferase